MKEAGDVVVEGECASEVDEGGICVDGGEDPACGGVDEEVEGVKLGHVVEGGGEGGVEAGENGCERVEGDVERAYVACDVGGACEEEHDTEGAGGRGDAAVEDALCDGGEAAGYESECGERRGREGLGDGEEEFSWEVHELTGTGRGASFKQVMT